MKRPRFRVALAAGLVVAGLSGAGHAGATDQTDTRAGASTARSIASISARLYNPHPGRRGDTKIRVFAGGREVYFLEVGRGPNDPIQPVYQLEDSVVRALCRTSDVACLVLTGKFTLSLSVR